MDYRTLSDTTSKQYLLQQFAITDNYGIRKINEDYMVAMGTAYASRVGERFRITLNSGEVFTVITGDIKANKHTDLTNRYSPINSISGNLLEFIVDKNIIDEGVIKRGDLSYYEKFEGDVVKIEGLGNLFEQD